MLISLIHGRAFCLGSGSWLAPQQAGGAWNKLAAQIHLPSETMVQISSVNKWDGNDSPTVLIQRHAWLWELSPRIPREPHRRAHMVLPPFACKPKLMAALQALQSPYQLQSPHQLAALKGLAHPC